MAIPLTFGAINGTDDVSQSEDLADCRKTTDDLLRCDLARRTFGGLDIAASSALLNADGQVRSIRIELEPGHFDLARQMLIGRYGPPERWSSFDESARIGMVRTERAAVISFAFPANAVAPARPEPGLIWTVLALIAAGLVLGWLAVRARRSKSPRLAPRRSPSSTTTLSMRETLERRVAEGRELRF